MSVDVPPPRNVSVPWFDWVKLLYRVIQQRMLLTQTRYHTSHPRLRFNCHRVTTGLYG